MKDQPWLMLGIWRPLMYFGVRQDTLRHFLFAHASQKVCEIFRGRRHCVESSTFWVTYVRCPSKNHLHRYSFLEHWQSSTATGQKFPYCWCNSHNKLYILTLMKYWAAWCRISRVQYLGAGNVKVHFCKPFSATMCVRCVVVVILPRCRYVQTWPTILRKDGQRGYKVYINGDAFSEKSRQTATIMDRTHRKSLS